MVFDLKNKVALITGGSSGIGLAIAKAILRNGVKGVTLADVNPVTGQQAIDDIEIEFGKNRAIFVKTDISDRAQFENAFKETIAKFKNIDILFNNAGKFNDEEYERTIAINLTGTLHGMLLGFENYLQKYRQGEESVIVNTASVAGVYNIYSGIPVYSSTKAAIVSLSRSWGDPGHYERTKVRCLAICPGATTTPMSSTGHGGKTFGEPYDKLVQHVSATHLIQGPEHVAEETVKIIQSAKAGTVWVIEGGEPSYECIFPER